MIEIQEKAPVVECKSISADIFLLSIFSPRVAEMAQPGQFLMVRISNLDDPLLRRPFSIHQVFADGTVQFLIKIVGRGSKILSLLTQGMSVDILGPLGKGFMCDPQGPVCLVGGGMGIAPLAFLGKRLQRAKNPPPGFVLLGARTALELNNFSDEFSGLGYRVQTATDDGSLGHHGFVTDLLNNVLSSVTTVYVCGPLPMMRIAAQKCLDAGVRCQVSMETSMACGVGACLGCTINGADGGYLHVCKQGPVFEANEVLWNH